MYRHVIWDFDGTLFDSYPLMAKAVMMALEEQGIYESYDKLMSMMKVSLRHVSDYFVENYNNSDTLITNSLRYIKELEVDNMKPFPGVMDVCRRIHQNKRFNHLYTHKGNSAIEYLKKYELHTYFSGLITKESNFKRKPDPEALLYLVEEFKINKSEAIMIGDRDIDILAAKNAGIDGCYYKSYPLYDCDIAKYTITDYRQLAALLELQ